MTASADARKPPAHALIPELLEKLSERIVRALDIRYHPAVAALHQDEVQGDAASFIVEARRHIGLVELLAQDRDRDRTEFPGRALHHEIIGLGPRREPGAAQRR